MTLLFNFLIVHGVLVSNILFVVFLALYFLISSFRQKTGEFVKSNILCIVFIISFLSVVGSLIYSELNDFTPCFLCWWQRVLIYPQALISLIAIIRKEKQIVFYLIPFSILGILISLYQSYVYWGGESLLPCTAEGGECSRVYVLEYGYITIPFMALSAFVYLLTASIIYWKNGKVNN